MAHSTQTHKLSKALHRNPQTRTDYTLQTLATLSTDIPHACMLSQPGDVGKHGSMRRPSLRLFCLSLGPRNTRRTYARQQRVRATSKQCMLYVTGAHPCHSHMVLHSHEKAHSDKHCLPRIRRHAQSAACCSSCCSYPTDDSRCCTADKPPKMGAAAAASNIPNSLGQTHWPHHNR
jgi:hypothetical protein